MTDIFYPRVLARLARPLITVMWGTTSLQVVALEDMHHLDEVTITARNLETRGLWNPALELSGAALTQRQGSTLGETLDNLPGVANSSFGPNVGRPVIRGMDGDRIRILQNSGANLDVSGLSNDHAVPIDPLVTERIEVLRGPASLQYGASAMGAVVNVIDHRIARERTFDAKGGAMGKAEIRAGGAANERSTGAMVEAGNDKWVMHVDAFDRSTQNLRVPKNMNCGEGLSAISNGRRVCNSASDSHGAAVGATLLFDRGYWGVSSSEYRSTYGTVAEPAVQIGMLRRHHAMEGLLRNLGTFENVKLQWGRTHYTHTEFDAASPASRFNNAGYDVRIEGRQHVLSMGEGMRLEGIVGLQSEQSDLQAKSHDGITNTLLPPSRTRSTGLFTFQALKTAWGQLSAGARAETVEVTAYEAHGPNDAQSQKFQPMSWALGAMRDLRHAETQNGWQMSTNLSASQRAPKDYELYAHGQHAATGTYEIGQPTNGLEKGTQLDVGGEYRQGPHKLGLTAFVSHFSNYLSLQAASSNFSGNQTDYKFEGVRARFYGIESTAKLRLIGGQEAWITANAAHGNLDLELRGDMVRARDLTHDSAMPRMAPMRFGADAVWSRGAWGARWGWVHSAAQNRVPAGGVVTDGYTLWHAGVHYHAHAWGPTHWLWFAKLDNITNQLAYSATSVLTQTMGQNAPPLAGRSLKVGAQVSF